MPDSSLTADERPLMRFTIQPATIADARVIAEFNCALAAETEGKKLDPLTVARGVEAVLTDPAKGRYFVAWEDDRIVGQLMHTWEWSDWRNGYFWWLQSVYVTPAARGRGLFRALFNHLAKQAADDPDVRGLRLYVEEHNQAARAVYTRLGLQPTGYNVLETLEPIPGRDRPTSC